MQTTCYQAVIADASGCTYTSSVARVNVARVANLNDLVTQELCKSGTATFTITDQFLKDNPHLVKWLDAAGNEKNGVLTYETPVLTAEEADECPFREYKYRVEVADSGCGPQQKDVSVRVFHEPVASPPIGPPAPLCYDQATKLNLQLICGNVTRWEQSTKGKKEPWAEVAGAGTTRNYWTPELTQTTWYRASVTNGICQLTTPALQVNVKPQLTATLTSSGTMACPGLPTLTAHPPAGYPLPPLTYTWYRNGVKSTTTNVPTLTAQPGNWRVVITDPACGSAKSNVVRVYGRPVVVIKGPCGVCQGGSIPLQADVDGGDPNCSYTFNWTASAGGWTGTGQTVTVSPSLAPGASVTYTVTASCAGCTVSSSHTVTGCPP